MRRDSKKPEAWQKPHRVPKAAPTLKGGGGRKHVGAGRRWLTVSEHLTHTPWATCFTVRYVESEVRSVCGVASGETASIQPDKQPDQHLGSARCTWADRGGARPSGHYKAWNGLKRPVSRRPLPHATASCKRIGRFIDPRRHAILAGLCHLLAMVRASPRGQRKGDFRRGRLSWPQC